MAKTTYTGTETEKLEMIKWEGLEKITYNIGCSVAFSVFFIMFFLWAMS